MYVDTCRQLKAGGGIFHLATLAAELADLLVELGRIADAQEWCAEAERSIRSDDVEGQACARVPRCKLLAIGGRTSEAEVLAREAAAIADETDELNLRAVVHAALAELLEADGRAEEASAEFGLARATYETKGNVAAVRRLDHRRTAASLTAFGALGAARVAGA